jgi:hypothetical protein
MKRKDYKEMSPEPKDYRGSDYSDDRSPSSWAATGRDDNDLYIWDEQPKESTPEGPNGDGNDGGDNEGGDDNRGGDDGGDDGGDNGDVQIASDVLSSLPSIHRGSLRVGR